MYDHSLDDPLMSSQPPRTPPSDDEENHLYHAYIKAQAAQGKALPITTPPLSNSSHHHLNQPHSHHHQHPHSRDRHCSHDHAKDDIQCGMEDILSNNISTHPDDYSNPTESLNPRESSRCSLFASGTLEEDERLKSSLKRLILAAVICTLFGAGEFIGGYLSNAVSIYSDALHMVSDVAGFLINIMGIMIARKQPSGRWTFAYQRVEILTAIISISIVWLLTGALVWEAVYRIQDPPAVNGKIMVLVGGVGIFSNMVLAGILWQGNVGHSHFGVNCEGHGHSHSKSKHYSPVRRASPHGSINSGRSAALVPNYSHLQDSSDLDEEPPTHWLKHVGVSPVWRSRVSAQSHDGQNRESASNTQPILHTPECSDDDHAHGSHGGGPHDHGHSCAKSTHSENVSVKSAWVHAIGDMTQNIGVLFAGALIWYDHDKYKIADPICTFVFAVLVFGVTIPLLKNAGFVLLEAAPPYLDLEGLRSALRRIPNVLGVHDLHCWSIGYNSTAMSCHLVINDVLDQQKDGTSTLFQAIVRRAQNLIKQKYGIHHSTIQCEVTGCKIC